MKVLTTTCLFALLASTAAHADNEVSLYGGFQWAPHSRVTGSYDDEPFNFLAAWEGNSFRMPPYYGIRFAHWNKNWGWALDYSHSKVYASDETLATNGLDVLEFTDGVNTYTANLMYRFQNESAFTPYIGLGAGFSMPHVEYLQTDGVKTFETQFGGPAAQAMAGVSYAFSDNWSMFGEYKIDYAQISADLQGPGNSWLKTDLVINALNVGVSYGW